MKKPKVVLHTYSRELDDGSRKLVGSKTICTCGERGNADLICALLRDGQYKTLLENYTKETQFFAMCVEI
ncbi:MAG: hypothetical protein RR063_11715 [Anaerovoracaceae bacterium]